jgi:hypothetical protein
MTYGELNKRNPGLTGEENLPPGLLVKVVRTVFTPPVAGDCTGGHGPPGVNTRGRIRLVVSVTNAETGVAMDDGIFCVRPPRRGR